MPRLQRSAAELFGVRAPAKNARDRLINTSIDLFYANGFQAIGLDRILSETGVTKTTFYKYFQSKDDLVVEALSTRDAWERQAFLRALREVGGEHPRAQLLAVFDVLDVWFNDPSFGGCLFINAAGEFPDPNDPIHRVAAAHKRTARDDFRDLARAAGAAAPEAFADLFALIVEGTLVMRHVHGRNDAATVARPAAEQLVRQFMG